MSFVVQWWDVLFVKGMHISSKNACLLNFYFAGLEDGVQKVDQLLSLATRVLTHEV